MQPLQKKTRLVLLLNLFILILGLSSVLVACQQAQPLTPIGDNTASENTEIQDLFSEEDLDNAILQIADTVSVQHITVGQTIPNGEPHTTDSNGEEDSLTPLLNVSNLSGHVCNIINNPNGKNKWRIQSIEVSNTTETVVGLFAVKQNGRAMQSIGCNAQGNKAVFSMKTSSTADYEIFYLDFSGATRQAYQLTSNGTNDLDVSMSSDGNTVVWQSGTGADRVITVRTYTDVASSNFTEIVLDGTVPFIEPSINSDGTLIAFLDIRNNQSNLLKHNLNNDNTVAVYTTSGKRSLAHPSISNDGKRIAWMDGTSKENLKVKDLNTNTTIEIVSNNPNLEHGFLADDGMSTIYTINRDDKAFTKVKNVDDGAIKNVGRVLNPPARYRGSVWVQAPTCGDNIGVYTGNLTLTTQNQVDVFLTNSVGKIDGDLILNPSTNLDFSPLSLLTEVTGKFELADNANQTTLTGFDCLETIGGHFAIGIFDFGEKGNPNLTSISGFSTLNSVGSGPNGGYFQISFNNALETIPTFSALTSINGLFGIQLNNALKAIPDNGFSALTSIGGFFLLNFNPTLQTIGTNAFTSLSSIEGDFNFYNNDTLQTIGINTFTALITVEGDFNFFNNHSLQTIPTNAFSALAFVSEGFSFSDNAALMSIPAFSALTSISGNFSFSNNTGLMSIPINAFGALTTINGSFEISGNATLQTIPQNAFSTLTSVDGDFQISGNAALQAIPQNAFPTLTSVGGEGFAIVSNSTLHTISQSAFPSLQSVPGEFYISINPSLQTIHTNAFSALTSVGGNLSIYNNPALQTLHANAFPALTSVDGGVGIGLTALSKISSFSLLDSIGDVLHISDNNNLESITGFPKLYPAAILGTTTVNNNPMLNCTNPIPNFTPVDVSTGNAVNCTIQP